MLFSPEERQRYARQLDLPGFGTAAQERLRKGRVFVVGCGGLGSPALAYLAAAGVGTIGFADGDIVDLSNLQRQILHSTSDIGRPKTESAEAHLRALNPHITLQPHHARLTADTARDILSPYDFVIDATDSFASKALVADICAILGKPYVIGAIDAFSGHGDYSELIRYLSCQKGNKKLKKIFIVHGEGDVRVAYAKHLKEAGFKQAYVPMFRESIELV